MATTAANVRVGVTGELHYAPPATAIPTDATTALNVAFKGLGYNTDEGVTETINKQTTKIRGWQNADTVRTITTEHDVTYSTTLAETNADTLAVFYGHYAAGTVEVKGGVSARGRWVLEVLDGDDVLRIVIPDGEVTETGDVRYVNGDPVGYPITLTCYPDANGVKVYKHYAALA